MMRSTNSVLLSPERVGILTRWSQIRTIIASAVIRLLNTITGGYLPPTTLLKLTGINLLPQLPRALEGNNPSGRQHHILSGGRVPAPAL